MKRALLILALLVLASCSAATAGDDGSSGGGEPRVPLGKADATGSCKVGATTYCGGKSKGTCWCDDKCAQYGDCCSDLATVCGAPSLGLDSPTIETTAQFEAMAFEGQDGVVLGKSVKFLIDARTATKPVVHFMNANAQGAGDAARFHYYFGKAVVPGFSETLQSFDQATYWTQNKRFFAGTLQQYNLGAGQTLYGIQFYPQDVIAEKTVIAAVKALKPKIRIPGVKLAFVATGPQQTTKTVASSFTSLKVENLTLDGVLGSLEYLPMQLGEAWGYLRIFPQDQDQLSAVDIPVFDELPLTLTVVAGTVTKAVQDASSHINLKSKERGTPNMVLRTAGPTHPELAAFANKPVHLTVSADGFELEPTTDAVVKQKLAERMNKPWVTLPAGPTGKVTSFREMCTASPAGCLKLSSTFGGKASQLGFLLHPKVLGLVGDPQSYSKKLGYDVAPAGVGVPVSKYRAFVEHASNAALAQKLAALIAAEKSGQLSVADRVAKAKEVQAMFYAATPPPGLVEDIVAAIKLALPADTKSVKLRSSANAEDIPGFDGAGLYESFRADLDEPNTAACSVVVDPDDGELEVKPRSVSCAVRAVYASLWNKRAIEERSFARIDHASAAMGLAIVRRYSEKAEVAANSVVVTRVLNSSGVYGYTFSSQVGNNVVTNPDPGTQSESVMAAFLPNEPATFTVTRRAKPDAAAPPLTTTVLTTPQMQTMLELTQFVEKTYCQNKPGYYSGSCSQAPYDRHKPKSLDMELKLHKTGQFLLKQVREFAGK